MEGDKQSTADQLLIYKVQFSLNLWSVRSYFYIVAQISKIEQRIYSRDKTDYKICEISRYIGKFFLKIRQDRRAVRPVGNL